MELLVKGTVFPIESENNDMAEQQLITEHEYTSEVLRTYAGTPNSTLDKLTLGALGLAGESGEVIDMIKKRLFQGHDIDQNKLLDELGDVFWYYTLILQSMGYSLQEVMSRNIEKLRHRYPDGFEAERSVNRSSV
ncbi:MAG: nucleoside triphosphate pyrophosphohydrolase family protein [Ktedonobacteraceae bacterium]